MKKQKTAKRSSVSRRDFFKSAGAGLLASEFASAAPGESAADPGASSVHFTRRSRLTQISPNLYVLRDTCNVYVLKDGNRALLIDFGSGHVLEPAQPDWRDQGAFPLGCDRRFVRGS